jgi:membrane protein DedA with SNARE-associated domain
MSLSARVLAAAIALSIRLPGMHVHLHKLHGPPFDYAGLALAAFASWVGVPGPGEPVLVAAAILAAKHQLTLGGVLAVAFLAAMLGGVTGWAVGRRAGRALLTARGPLLRARRRALEHGDELFGRYPVLAIVLTPSFVAGVHRVGTVTYLLVNLVSAALWTAGLGVGAYLAGPTVLDVFADVGLVFSVVIGVLVAAVVGGAWVRRRRARTA